MIKRGDCHCPCHLEIGGRQIVIHCMLCCEPDPDFCERCKPFKYDPIKRAIYHGNGHVWPGYAGEPNDGDYGGSDF